MYRDKETNPTDPGKGSISRVGGIKKIRFRAQGTDGHWLKKELRYHSPIFWDFGIITIMITR